MKRILVCEDEAAIRAFVVINLKRAGYEVVEAESGERALEQYQNYNGQIDLALLDVMLPGIDGLEVCRRLRAEDSSIGIIFLTARTQEHEKVRGLMTGADDYVTKPFSPSELVARIDALCRRIRPTPHTEVADENYLKEIVSGEFVLNLRNRTLSRRGELLDLTQLEFQIMEYFLTSNGQLLLRNDILRHVWGDGYFGDDKVVDVNIRRLRMKVEDDASHPQHILTVWGKGYKWSD